MLKLLLECFTEVFQFLHTLVKRNRAGDIIEKTADMYDIMNEMVHGDPSLNVHRFLILAAHNGGENFKTFTPQFASCRHEVVRDPVESVKEKYQSLSVDNSYIQLLKRVYKDNDFDINCEELDKNSLLRNIYESEGVTHVRLFFIRHTKKEFVFGSIATVSPQEHFVSPRHRTEFASAIARIRTLCN